MEILKVKRKAIGSQVTQLLNEVDTLITQEALNLETLRMQHGRLGRPQQQLTEVDNATGILMLEEDVEEEYTRCLHYDNRLKICIARWNLHKERCSVSLNLASTFASRTGLPGQLTRHQTGVQQVRTSSSKIT